MYEKILKKSIGWRKGFALSLEIYKLTKKFPKEELYCLTIQMRRCAMSIPLNISEGLLRSSKKEFSRFLTISRGSCGELVTQLLFAYELHYITEDELNEFQAKTTELAKILTASIKTLQSRS